MASHLLHLGLLFTITLSCIRAQGADDIIEEPKTDPGLALIPAPYQILVQPKAKSVLLNCSLNVTDKNLLPLRYKWLKDGKPTDQIRPKLKLEVLRNGSLLLQPRKNRGRNRRLDGIYDCHVLTATDAAVIARRVEVVFASISKNSSHEPSSVEAYRGGVARFECSIWAAPSASYVWNRNETQLPQDDQRFTSLSSGVLQMSDIDLNDAGMYWCQATIYLLNFQEQAPDFNWKPGRHTELRIRPDPSERPATILASPQNVSVLVGHTAEFECFADGKPMPSIVWKKKDSSTVFGSQNLFGHGNLRLTRVKPEDAGLYECIVSGRNKVLKANATLTVLEPPKLEQGLESYIHPVSKIVSMTCRFSGSPQPKITWYHNGRSFSDLDWAFEKKIDSKNGETIYMYTVEKKNAGYYQCIAENSVGQAMSMGLIKIFSNPGAPVVPKNVKCVATSSTSIMVTWDHLPNETFPSVVSYQVVGNTKPPLQELCPVRVNETKQQCEINKYITPFTNYSVRVQAYNSKGGSDITDKVYVQTLEDVPDSVPLLSLSSPQFHSILVRWTPLTRDQSRGHVTAYKIYYRLSDMKDEISKEVPANQTSFLITGVQPEQSYEMLVVASTSAGFTKRDKWPWTQYTTPQTDATSPPILDVKYINKTSVLIEWQAPAGSATLSPAQAIISYNLELQSLSKPDDPVQKFTLAPTAHSLTLTELDEQQSYEVTLVAVSQQGSSSPASYKFRLVELQYQLVPGNFHPLSVHSNSVTLTWTSVSGFSVTYEICYKKELDKSDELCKISVDVPVTVSGLDSFVRYEFNIKALMNGVRGISSKGLIVQTKEDRPSPPLNLTLEVKKNSVFLRWLPPAQPNGIITHYIIMYSKDTAAQEGDIPWKTITEEGTEMSARVDDLESGRYFFKLAAENKAGVGAHTDVMAAIAECRAHIGVVCSLVTETTIDNSVATGTPSSSESPGITNIQISIIVGCLIGLVCLVLLMLVVIWYSRHRSQIREVGSNTSHSPIYHGNGHVSPVPGRTNHHVPGNGHVNFVGSTPVGYRQEMINMHESAPMLTQIPENEHSDSKGGPDISTPNGFRPNGVVKGKQRTGGQTYNSHSSEELNRSHNSEELHGLIAAMLASANDNDMSRNNGGQKIPMSPLDDIDRGDEGLGDFSSQDSGTECSGHAGVPQVGDGACTEDGSLVSAARSGCRRHHQHGWEIGREVDEIGGVFIDRSTGAVIGEVPPTDAVFEEIGDKVEGDGFLVDRDSGHGSEAKSQCGVLNCADTETRPLLGANFAVSCPNTTGHEQSEESVLPAVSPPASLLISSAAAPQPSSTALVQQLSCPSSSSRNQSSSSSSSRPQHHRPRAAQQTSPADLPPPPPTPPLLSATLSPVQGSTAALSAAVTAELNNSSSSGEGEQHRHQQLSDDSGSISHRHLEGTSVVFSQSPLPPDPPHIV